jgi:hypothetical protein
VNGGTNVGIEAFVSLVRPSNIASTEGVVAMMHFVNIVGIEDAVSMLCSLTTANVATIYMVSSGLLLLSLKSGGH